ncbi:carboxymuconolactone decarboxylase family protein [Microbispora sp. ATCC PTA-5024]|uniref:carboxymuconolactone decarboxylase family protein n=1 Tax=Microbispora sp. ATCC PTA-5024 TaxID=316330 RepID=UPI0003DCA6F2|nr:peroxidase-related enzyme [Microbispora sp. ATCC PTA-5024]ETK33742.1 carboxymuconolactone decarboxylase [Microbispora sp. ATCC PTA-5024]
MAHIALTTDEPGIRGLFRFRPETARPLNELVEVLLRGESTLSRGERELIAAYVSALNECTYCYSSHAAYAAAQLPEGMELVEQVRAGLDAAPVSARLRALLGIAASVQRGGREVSADEVAAARAEGATDVEIHDTVLIAAAFCMFNRYVDGLGTFAPDDPGVYAARAKRIAEDGYLALLRESQNGSQERSEV